jgi:hypothetical protein
MSRKPFLVFGAGQASVCAADVAREPQPWRLTVAPAYRPYLAVGWSLPLHPQPVGGRL